MRANGFVLARDREPGEPTRGHVIVPEPNHRIATALTTMSFVVAQGVGAALGDWLVPLDRERA